MVRKTIRRVGRQAPRPNETLVMDENNPARVWREGRARAQVWGFPLYPDGIPGKRPKRPKKNQPERHPNRLGGLERTLMAPGQLPVDVPTTGIPGPYSTAASARDCRLRGSQP